LLQSLFADASHRLIKWSISQRLGGDEDEDDQEMEPLSIDAASPRADRAVSQLTDAELYQYLAHFCDREFLKMFTEYLFHHLPSGKTDPNSRQNIFQLLAFLSIICLVMPGTKSTILGALMFSRAGLASYRWLWDSLVQSELLAAAGSDKRTTISSLEKLISQSLAPQWYALMTFAEVLGRFLLTCGHEEFYGPEDNVSSLGIPLFISVSAYLRVRHCVIYSFI
jgi:hypothetical protein